MSETAPGRILGLGSSLTTNAAILAGGVATGVLAARLLGPSGRGALAAILFWPQLIAAVSFLSLNEATTYHVGADPRRAKSIRVAGLSAALFLSLVASLAAFVLLPWLLGPDRQTLVRVSQTYAAVFLPFQYVFLVCNAADRGALQFRRYNLFRTGVPILYALGLLLLTLRGAATVEFAALVSLAAVVGMALLRVLIPGPVVGARFTFSGMKTLLRTGLSFHAVTLLLALSTQIDRLAVLRLFPDESVGYYMVAYALASGGLGVVSASFTTVLFPHLSRAKDSPLDGAKTLALGIRIAMLLAFLVGGVLTLLGPPLVPILFGGNFEPATPLVAMLAIAFSFSALREVVAYSIRGLGASRPAAVSQLLTLVVFCLCLFPAVRFVGLSGVAISLIMSNIPSYVYLARYLRKEYRLATKELWGIRPAAARELLMLVRGVAR